MNSERFLTIIAVGIVVLVLFFVIIQFNKVETPIITETVSPTIINSPTPDMKINKNLPTDRQGKKYTALLKTSKGEIIIELNSNMTPKTVNNFITLAKKDFYNNTIFHRVIKGFMIQGGDPKGDGTGGPGYKFDDEAFEGEYSRGTIAMANSGPNTNGSQFFIMHADYALPKNYVIFGKVIKGMDVVDAIANIPVESNGMGEQSKPIDPIKVLTIKIEEK